LPSTSSKTIPARFKAAALDVLTLEGSRTKEITGFVMHEIFPRFGLPLELAS
jgi:hypothetical protein